MLVNMKELNYVCLSVIIFLNIYSGICKSVVEVSDELVLDTTKSPIPVKNSTISKTSKISNEKEKIKTKRKEEEKHEEKEIASDIEVIDEAVEKDDHVEEIKKPVEKDDKNEKLCEELCSSCEGSENVFDIAEPSCFCKVTTVNSVKCLEDKVTDLVKIKVIAYVETDPQSQEERRVAQYLKEREEFSLNRNRRCCGNVGATNPQHEREVEARKERGLGLKESLRLEKGQVGVERNDAKDAHYEEDYDDEDEDVLGARRITAGPELENLWRKALRAEDTSPERSEEDDDTAEMTQKPTPVKRNNQAENRRIYKYEPPADYKSKLGQKLQETSNDDLSADDTEKTANRKSYLGIARPAKSTREEKKKVLQDENEDEESKTSEKVEKMYKNNEKIIQKETKSLKELIEDLKYLNEKLPSDPTETEENSKPKITKYKSLDDMLYDRELKRQKMLSSIREKYAKLPEPAAKLENNAASEENEEDDVVIEPIKNKRKKYANNKIGILGSRGKGNSVNEKRDEKKTNKDKDDFENKDRDIKLKSYKDEADNKFAPNKRYKSNKNIDDIKDDSQRLDAEKSPDKIKKSSLGFTRKLVVSPFIDNENDEDKDEKKSTPKYIYRYSKNKNVNDPGTIPSSKYEKDEKTNSFPNKYRNVANKEYSDKDNELGGSRKSKESLSSLISKIRAMYVKNDRTDGIKPKGDDKIIARSRNNDKEQNILSSPASRKGDRIESERKTKIFASRDTKTNSEETDNDDESIEQRKIPYLLGQRNRSKYTQPQEDEEVEIPVKKQLPKKVKAFSKVESPSMKYDGNVESSTEGEEEVNHPVVNKYLKAKYSGVKPNLIREEKGLINKRSKFRKKLTEEANSAEEKDKIEKIDNVKEIPRKSRYLKLKEDGLQKLADKEDEKSPLNSVKRNQNAFENPNENLQQTGDQKLSLKELLKQRKASRLGSSQKSPEARPMEFVNPKEISEEKGYPGLTLEERKRLLESKLRDLSDRKENSKQNNYYNLKSRADEQESITPIAKEEKRISSEGLNDNAQETGLKKISLKELIEQRRASRVGSSQTKPNEPPEIELPNRKEGNSQDKELPTKSSLKDLMEQRKLERQNALDAFKLKNLPVVSSPAKTWNDKDTQLLMDQNPQKHCEQCMEYVSRMTQMQKEQMLGQKPFSTRSISTKSSHNLVSPDEDQTVQDKFLSCQCYENQNGGSPPQSNPAATPSNLVQIPNQYTGSPDSAMLGKPFNMNDVSKTFENIKTEIASSVKGANDKIANGFNDLKTNIQNEYEQVSHSSLAENLKESSDKVSQKISNAKDSLVNGLTDMTHKIEEKYDSINQKGLNDNRDATSVASQTPQSKDGIVSQAAPNQYMSNAQTVIPADRLRTKYIQAKYINPNEINNNNLQMNQMSGNDLAPTNTT